MKPHKHAELIKSWADGAKVEYFNAGDWVQTDHPAWDENYAYRIKPEPAAPKWPQTTMNHQELKLAEEAFPDYKGALRSIANAALAHACEAGEVVPADKLREIEAKARAEGIKEYRKDTVITVTGNFDSKGTFKINQNQLGKEGDFA